MRGSIAHARQPRVPRAPERSKAVFHGRPRLAGHCHDRRRPRKKALARLRQVPVFPRGSLVGAIGLEPESVGSSVARCRISRRRAATERDGIARIVPRLVPQPPRAKVCFRPVAAARLLKERTFADIATHTGLRPTLGGDHGSLFCTHSNAWQGALPWRASRWACGLRAAGECTLTICRHRNNASQRDRGVCP